MKTGVQDLELVLRIKVPERFVGWQADAVTFDYRTENNNVLDNNIDVNIEDVDGVQTILTGASSLFSSTWNTAHIGFADVYNWEIGEEITVRIKMNTSNVGAVYPGKLVLNFING